MRLSNLLMIFLFFFTTTGCGWFDKDNPITETSGKLKIVWKIPFEKGKLLGSEAPAIYDNKVIFSNFPAFGPEPFFALDAEDGDPEYWRWQDYITESTTSVSGKYLPVTLDNVLCLPLANGALGINMDNGKTIWKDNFSSPGRYSVFESSLIKQAVEYHTNANRCYLKMIDIKTGKGRIVFDIDTISTQFFNLTAATVERKMNGDSVLYFTFSESFQKQDGSLESFAQNYAYNLTQKKILWTKNEIHSGPPILKDNKLYYAGINRLLCLDPLDGSIIWDKNVPDIALGYFKLYEDKLVAVGSGSPSFVEAYSLADGTRLWQIPFDGNTSEPLYYKGIMYFTCASDGSLWAVRVSNGEIIWKEKSPDIEFDDDSSWSFGINVDPVRNKLYVASFTSAFCLEPAE